ncbi:Superoxide dismutase [Cu-Zn] [Bulinus truncatus]|nr:Superoxide dismutase [Cu-Zn] [Bulinus truncatus]
MSQALVVFGILVFSCSAVNIRPPKETRQATCILSHNNDYNGHLKFSGTIKITETSGEPLNLEANITGQAKSGDNEKINRGFHVHQFGYISESCLFTGPHFNPDRSAHGGKESQIRHVGDYGNIELMTNDFISVQLTDSRSSLFGDDSILGRSLVIHEHEDDLGTRDTVESKTIGSSGAIVSCCVIVLDREVTN